jgi:phosphomannomutase
MAWHGKTLGQLLGALHAEFGEHHYGRLDLELKAGQKEKAIAHFSDGKLKTLIDWPVTRREQMDGIKVYLDEVGWVMVRASGTENLLRIYSETTKMDTTRRVLQALATTVQGLD